MRYVRGKINSKKGSALLYTLFFGTVASALIFATFRSTQLLNNSQKEKRTATEMRSTLNALLDYLRIAIDNQWCLDPNTGDPIENRPCLEWEATYLPRLLLSKSERIDAAMERVLNNTSASAPSPLHEEKEDCTEDSLRCYKMNLGPFPLNSMGTYLRSIVENITERETEQGIYAKKRKAQSVSFTIERIKHGSTPQYSNASMLKISAEIQLSSKGLFSNHPKIEALIAYQARELNQFALMVSNDLRLDGLNSNAQDTSLESYSGGKNSYNKKHLSFLSPIFVNGSIVLPSPSEGTSSYTPVTFRDRVYLGNGNLKYTNNSGALVSFEPKSYGAPESRYYGQSERFGAFQKGLFIESERDHGLDVLFSGGITNPDAFTQSRYPTFNSNPAAASTFTVCKNLKSKKFNKEESAETDFLFNTHSSSNNRIENLLALSNENEFVPSPLSIGRVAPDSSHEGNNLFRIVEGGLTSTLDKRPPPPPEEDDDDESNNNNGNSNNFLPFVTKYYFFKYSYETHNAEENTWESHELKDLLTSSGSVPSILKADIHLAKHSIFSFAGESLGSFYLPQKGSLEIYHGTNKNNLDPVLTIRTEPVTDDDNEGNLFHYNQVNFITEAPQISILNEKEINIKITPIEYGSEQANSNSFVQFRSPQNINGILFPFSDFEFNFTSTASSLQFPDGSSDWKKARHPTLSSSTSPPPPSRTANSFTACSEIPTTNNFRGTASSDKDFLESTQFSWYFRDPINTRDFTDFTNNGSIGSPFIFDASNSSGLSGSQAFDSYSILGKCTIRSNAKLVSGFYVCQELIIEDRSEALEIVGTFIVGRARISLSAIENGIKWSSIYHPDALYKLRKSGILKPSPSSVNPLGFLQECENIDKNPQEPVWHPKPSLSTLEQRHHCSVNSIKGLSDNFRWSRVNPDCGLNPPDYKDMLCKRETKKLDSSELFRRIFF